MKLSWKLGTVAGIGLFVHWTFLILIAWVVLAHLVEGRSLTMAAEGVVFVVAIFACVVLHELGHALTARRYNIRTRDIILLPIGGVARLERIPEDPRQEFWVALAGPAVSLALAAGLFVVVRLLVGLSALSEVALVGGHFVAKLMWVNVALVAFNLLPAFPMDGGRVLRAALARRMEYSRATQIAANTGQGMAIVFGFLGLFLNPFLLFIALFVYLGAQAEAQFVKVRTSFRGFAVRDAMMTRFRALAEQDTVSRAADELLAGDQQDFPVVHDHTVLGMLPRSDLIRTLAKGEDVRIGEVMRRDCGCVDDADSLESTYRRMKETGCRTLPVVRGGELIGMISLENIGEWMMIQKALHQQNNVPTARKAGVLTHAG
jgi:Zn-dependent protease